MTAAFELLRQISTMGWAAVVVGTLLLVRSAGSEAHEWDVDDALVPTLRALNDRSFEHDTQAATGQTTGSWLVLFSGSDCGKCGDVESVLVQVISQFSEGLLIIAKVNTSESPRTAKRFNVDRQPQLKLFRDRHMFSYGGQWSAASIASFIQDGWQVVPVEDVPKEVTLVNEIQEKFWALFEAIIEYLANRPGILAGVSSIIAMGGYLFTKQWLTKKQKQKRPRGRLRKRAD